MKSANRIIYWYIIKNIQEISSKKDPSKKTFSDTIFYQREVQNAFLKFADFSGIALKNKITTILKQSLENSIKKEVSTRKKADIKKQTLINEKNNIFWETNRNSSIDN